MNRIARAEYEPFAALKHVFLVGNLQRWSPHPFVRDPRLELILCFYDPGDDGLPHWHAEVTEYELVLEGEIGHRDTLTGETQWFGPGDLHVLAPGTCVQRIVRTPTRTVAVKVPSNAEKIHCVECPRECASRLASCVEEGIRASR
jgi:hypothetical protein